MMTRKRLIVGIVACLVVSFTLYACRWFFEQGTPQDRLLGGLGIGTMCLALVLNFVLVRRKIG